MSSLLSLHDATIEWRSGLPSRCVASVRYLDTLTLCIDHGDCVVIRHRDPASARVLLAALAGSPLALHPAFWRGDRRASVDLRIRRASIRAEAFAGILSGWGTARASPAHPRPESMLRAVAERPAAHFRGVPLVHLLRVSRCGGISLSEAAHCEQWARRQCERGNAVVLLAQSAPVSRHASAFTSAPRQGAHRPAGSTSEFPDPGEVRDGRSRHIRELYFRDGRLRVRDV